MAKGKVTSIPLTVERASRILREVAKDTSRVFQLAFPEDQRWQELVTSKQVLLCLRDGTVITTPRKDENGNWVCLIHRLCGGENVVVTVAIEIRQGGNNVYVLKHESGS